MSISPGGERDRIQRDSFITQQGSVALYCDREEHGEIDITSERERRNFPESGKANRDQKARQHFTDSG